MTFKGPFQPKLFYDSKIKHPLAQQPSLPGGDARKQKPHKHRYSGPNPSTNSTEAAAGLTEKEAHDFFNPIYALAVVDIIRSRTRPTAQVENVPLASLKSHESQARAGDTGTGRGTCPNSEPRCFCPPGASSRRSEHALSALAAHSLEVIKAPQVINMEMYSRSTAARCLRRLEAACRDSLLNAWTLKPPITMLMISSLLMNCLP